MEQLAILLESDKRVLFITGAGISVQSGIPPYRGTSTDAVWSNFVTDWATRKCFLESPTKWWNKFYLETHYKREFLEAEPNRGHEALAYLCRQFPNACVITQNVDGLHTRGTGKISDAKLIEIHGSMHGGFKCVEAECEWVQHIIEESEVDLLACAVDSSAQPGDSNFQLKKCPICPKCSSPLLPQALLFDEEYSSHPFYEWDAANDWMQEACAIVFVGTSFSVGLTRTALEASRKRSATLFNVNLTSMNSLNTTMRKVDRERMIDLFGPSEQILPLLAQVMSTRTKANEQWNQYAPVHQVWQRNEHDLLVRSKAPVVASTQETEDEKKKECSSKRTRVDGSSSSSSSSSSTLTSTSTFAMAAGGATSSSSTSLLSTRYTMRNSGKRQKRKGNYGGAALTLQNMGFTNKEAVQLALRNHAGSVENAVCELTRQQDQQHETTSVPLLSHSTRQQRRRQRKQKMGKIKKNNMPGLVLLVSQGRIVPSYEEGTEGSSK